MCSTHAVIFCGALSHLHAVDLKILERDHGAHVRVADNSNKARVVILLGDTNRTGQRGNTRSWQAMDKIRSMMVQSQESRVKKMEGEDQDGNKHSVTSDIACGRQRVLHLPRDKQQSKKTHLISCLLMTSKARSAAALWLIVTTSQ